MPSQKGYVTEEHMNAIDLLKADHRKVEELFEQFEKASQGKKRSEIMKEIETELKVHAAIEEKIFYPALKKVDKDGTLEAIEEHDLVKHVIAQLARIDGFAEDAGPKVKVLKELVKHHVDEEEKHLFKEMKHDDKVDLEALGDELQQEKAKLLKRHHAVAA